MKKEQERFLQEYVGGIAFLIVFAVILSAL